MRINNSRIDIFKLSITKLKLCQEVSIMLLSLERMAYFHSFLLIGYGRILHIPHAINISYIIYRQWQYL